jgi:hypothetical protein
MSDTLKFKVDFDSEETKSLLQFISDTQEGKYTDHKPDITQVTFKRLEIQEQNKSHQAETTDDVIILYGTNY